MNKKGFISISVVYSFFLVFLAIIVSIILIYSQKRILLNEVKKDIRDNLQTSAKGYLNDVILASYGGKDNLEVVTDFNSINDGLYKAADELGMSYYFRGKIDNNYLKFGKDKNGKDMYWRIVRINGDESIKIIYEYSLDNSSSQEIKNGLEFNNYLDENGKCWVDFNKYDGSFIEEALDKWYEDNLRNYSKYLSDYFFCNDREESSIKDPTDNRNLIYKSAERLLIYEAKNPTFGCSQSVDKLSVSRKNLKYPIGIITADEVMFAGGLYNVSTDYYLVDGTVFWSMTGYDNSVMVGMGDADLWYVQSDGSLMHSNGPGRLFNSVRPVVNLARHVRVKTGDGTIGMPYEVSLDGEE